MRRQNAAVSPNTGFISYFGTGVRPEKRKYLKQEEIYRKDRLHMASKAGHDVIEKTDYMWRALDIFISEEAAVLYKEVRQIVEPDP